MQGILGCVLVFDRACVILYFPMLHSSQQYCGSLSKRGCGMPLRFQGSIGIFGVHNLWYARLHPFNIFFGLGEWFQRPPLLAYHCIISYKKKKYSNDFILFGLMASSVPFLQLILPNYRPKKLSY